MDVPNGDEVLHGDSGRSSRRTGSKQEMATALRAQTSMRVLVPAERADAAFLRGRRRVPSCRRMVTQSSAEVGMRPRNSSVRPVSIRGRPNADGLQQARPRAARPGHPTVFRDLADLVLFGSLRHRCGADLSLAKTRPVPRATRDDRGTRDFRAGRYGNSAEHQHALSASFSISQPDEGPVLASQRPRRKGFSLARRSARFAGTSWHEVTDDVRDCADDDSLSHRYLITAGLSFTKPLLILMS